MSTDFATPSIHAILTHTIQSNLYWMFIDLLVISYWSNIRFPSSRAIWWIGAKISITTIYLRPTKNGLWCSRRKVNRKSLCIRIMRHSVGIFGRTLFGNQILLLNYWFRWNRHIPRTMHVNWAFPNENVFSPMRSNWTFTKKSIHLPVAWRSDLTFRNSFILNIYWIFVCRNVVWRNQWQCAIASHHSTDPSVSKWIWWIIPVIIPFSLQTKTITIFV